MAGTALYGTGGQLFATSVSPATTAAAPAAGLSSFLGPAALTFAGVGGILGGFSAARQNRALKKSAKEAMRRINDTITQVRAGAMRETVQLARNAQITQGQVMNVSPRTQSVIETLASRFAAGVASDQFAIDETAARQETALEAQKQDIVNRTNSQMTSPIIGAVQGAVGGFLTGASVGGAIDQLRDSEQALSFTRDALEHQEALRGFETATASANLSAAQSQSAYISDLRQNLRNDIARLHFQRFQRTSPFRFFMPN